MKKEARVRIKYKMIERFQLNEARIQPFYGKGVSINRRTSIFVLRRRYTCLKATCRAGWPKVKSKNLFFVNTPIFSLCKYLSIQLHFQNLNSSNKKNLKTIPPNIEISHSGRSLLMVISSCKVVLSIPWRHRCHVVCLDQWKVEGISSGIAPPHLSLSRCLNVIGS